MYRQRGILVLVRHDQHRQRCYHSRFANSPGPETPLVVEGQAWSGGGLPDGVIVGFMQPFSSTLDPLTSMTACAQRLLSGPPPLPAQLKAVTQHVSAS